MKKILLFAAVACAVLSANAQALQALPKANFAPAKSNAFTTSVAKAPAKKVDLKENQVLVGLYTTDDIDNGLGLGEKITMEVATEIYPECYAGMSDLKIDAVRFGLYENAEVNSVKVYTVNEQGAVNPLAQQALSNINCTAGWNVVEFDSPVEVPMDAEELLVSYEINLKAGEYYPIGSYSGSKDVSFYGYGPLGQNGEVGWYNFGTQYGTTAIQLICECAPAVGFTLTPTYYDCPAVAMNSEFKPTIGLMSTSEAAVSDIEYTINFGGKDFTSTATFKPAIPQGFGKVSSFQPVLTSPDKVGALPLELTINKVNGVDVEAPQKFTFTQNVVTRVVPRYSIVEEYTGTGCPWCPRGWAGMEMVKEQLSDIAGVIAIHQYNSTDPMYVTNYHTMTYQGAPGAMVDRSGKQTEPYYGDNDEGIIKTVKRYASVTPEVAVEVSATWTDGSQTKIDASAVTEFLTDLEGSELVFVLTADGLTGTTSAWKQYNNYAGYTASQFGLSKTYDPLLSEFCSGGQYGKSQVTLVFNDVMIGSSWPSSAKPNAVPAFTTTAAGEKASSAYTLSLPTKTALKNALIKEQIYVTAMVIKADGTIANAARCRVEAPEGINTVLAPVADGAMYDLSGRVNNSGNGIRIQNGKKVIR